MTTDAIGGYFGWERGTGAGLSLLHAVGYQSARCAIVAVLRAANAKRIWVPNYVCGAVNDALSATGINVRRYVLSSDWGIPSDIDPEANDWLLCVDYFGLCRTQVEAAIERFGAHRVLVDAAQSLFFPPLQGTTVVYSPRKFVAAPDGGLAVANPTNLTLNQPPKGDECASLARCAHLHSRAEGRVELGYRQFQIAEKSLEDCEPQGMSRYTAHLLATIDADRIATRRINNYLFLSSALADLGLLVPPLPQNVVPLCCPVLGVDGPTFRHALTLQRIFTPSYWPGARIPSDDTFGNKLQTNALYLPCDQRYAPEGLAVLIQAVSEVLACAATKGSPITI